MRGRGARSSSFLEPPRPPPPSPPPASARALTVSAVEARTGAGEELVGDEVDLETLFAPAAPALAQPTRQSREKSGDRGLSLDDSRTKIDGWVGGGGEQMAGTEEGLYCTAVQISCTVRGLNCTKVQSQLCGTHVLPSMRPALYYVTTWHDPRGLPAGGRWVASRPTRGGIGSSPSCRRPCRARSPRVSSSRSTCFIG